MDPALSDHYAVRCKVLLAKPPFEWKEIAYRGLKRMDFARFRKDINNSKLMENDDSSLNDLIDRYNIHYQHYLMTTLPSERKS